MSVEDKLFQEFEVGLSQKHGEKGELDKIKINLPKFCQICLSWASNKDVIFKALEARVVVTHSLEWQRWGARAVKGKMVKGDYASARHATPSL